MTKTTPAKTERFKALYSEPHHHPSQPHRHISLKTQLLITLIIRNALGILERAETMGGFTDWLRNAVFGARSGPTDKEEAQAYEDINRSHKERHAPKAFTMDDLKDDVWAAFEKRIPEHASLDLLKLAKENIGDLKDHITEGDSAWIEHFSKSDDLQKLLNRVGARGQELDRLIDEREGKLDELRQRWEQIKQERANEKDKGISHGRGGPSM